LLSFFKEGDLFVWDRGFRDSEQLIRNMGIDTSMPSFLPPGQAQFTTAEANESRLITKIRWVVEAANGRIKNKFKFFDDVLQNSYLPKIGSYFRIACAFFNAFAPPIHADKPENIQLAQRMVERVGIRNLLQEQLSTQILTRCPSQWERMSAEGLEEFPVLTEVELREFTFGIYQLKQAASYTGEHLTEAGD